MREIVNDMYSIQEMEDILGINKEAIRQVEKRIGISHIKYNRVRYYNLEDFIPYKVNRMLPFNKREYSMIWVQSLDKDFPDDYYGISEKEEIKINIRKLFNLRN